MNTEQIKVCVALAIPYGFAVIITAARFVSRFIGKQPLWIDDYLMIPAFIGATYRVIIFGLAFQLGLGLPDDEVSQILRDRNESPYALSHLTFINNFGWSLALGFAKLSICALYWRLFQYSNMRMGILITAGLTAVWTVAVTISMTTQCLPIESSWNPEVPGTCINTLAANTWPVVSHFVIDVLILALPIVVVSQLRQLLPHQRITVVLLFMFGVCICVIAIICLALTVQWNMTDCYASSQKCLSYYLQVYRVTSAEPSLIVISASIPTLTPLYHRLCGNRHAPVPAPRLEKDALDATQNKRMPDTLDGNLSTQVTECDSTRALATVDEPGYVKDLDQSRSGTGRSDVELQERVEVAEL